MSPSRRRDPARRDLVVAIDQGTTGTTVLVLDRKGRTQSRGYAELRQHYPKPGWVEHDGGEIWRSVLDAMRAARVPGKRVAAIGITNQRETTLLWDRRTGKPVARAIVWQDRRTAEDCAALRKRGVERTVRRRTGLVLDPYFSATKVAWLLRHSRGLRGRAARGEIAFGTVDTWLLWQLTLGKWHVTDFTNASRTMLFDIEKKQWSAELLRIFDVPSALLPEARTSSGEFGRTRGVPGLDDGTPILGVAGDQQAALYGQGCTREGQAKNTYGTGCFLLLHTGDRRVRPRGGLLSTIACDQDGGPAYALEGSVFIAGAAVQWLRDGLQAITTAAEIEALARSVPDSGGTIFVPAFVGLGAPHWRADVRGAWFGITRGTTRAHLARAILESIAFQTRGVVDAMSEESGTPLRRLRVDGGAAANDFLLQFQADVLGVAIERPRQLESTALGAAALAARALGWWPGGRPPGTTARPERVFRPRMSRARRDAHYQAWQAAVARLLA